MEIDYNEDMRIDETALDVEWLDQVELAMKYGKLYAAARKKFTKAEEKVKVVRAELIKKANSDPVKYCKKEKPNAADIEAYYRKHPEHIEAKDEWIEAQYELDMAEIAKNEVSFTRKAALENLVTLHGQQYFAGPKMPRNISFEAGKRREQKETDTKIGQKLKRRREE